MSDKCFSVIGGESPGLWSTSPTKGPQPRFFIPSATKGRISTRHNDRLATLTLWLAQVLVGREWKSSKLFSNLGVRRAEFRQILHDLCRPNSRHAEISESSGEIPTVSFPNWILNKKPNADLGETWSKFCLLIPKLHRDLHCVPQILCEFRSRFPRTLVQILEAKEFLKKFVLSLF